MFGPMKEALRGRRSPSIRRRSHWHGAKLVKDATKNKQKSVGIKKKKIVKRWNLCVEVRGGGGLRLKGVFVCFGLGAIPQVARVNAVPTLLAPPTYPPNHPPPPPPVISICLAQWKKL
jgi:hypothetical protein